MSDRDQHTATPTSEPPPWDTSDALRAAFAFELRETDRDTLQAVCELVQELARESGQVHEQTRSLVVAQLRAVVADLGNVVAFLHFIGSQLGELGTYEENRLAVQAESWAPRLAELAGEVEAELPAA